MSFRIPTMAQLSVQMSELSATSSWATTTRLIVPDLHFEIATTTLYTNQYQHQLENQRINETYDHELNDALGDLDLLRGAKRTHVRGELDEERDGAVDSDDDLLDVGRVVAVEVRERGCQVPFINHPQHAAEKRDVPRRARMPSTFALRCAMISYTASSLHRLGVFGAERAVVLAGVP